MRGSSVGCIGRKLIWVPSFEQIGGAQFLGPDDELAFDLRQLRAQVFRLDGLAEQLGAEFRVGDGDQRQRPFLHALAVQVGDAVLGDDVVHVAARGDHAGAGREARHDARDRAVLGRRGQGDDRLAARRAGRAAVEVDLPADAGVESRAERVGADLAGEVDLQRGVDRHHLVLLADDERVVDVLGRVEGEQRVVVDVVVEPLGAHAEAGDDLAAVERLAAAGDHARLDQVDDAVGDHLGVDAQVLLVLEELQHRLRDAADAELDGRAVLDQRGDVLADLARCLASRLGRRALSMSGASAGHQDVEVVDVEEAVAQRARHVAG